MKKSITELWIKAQLMVGHLASFVAMVIGIPGQLLCDASNALDGFYYSVCDRVYRKDEPETEIIED